MQTLLPDTMQHTMYLCRPRGSGAGLDAKWLASVCSAKRSNLVPHTPPLFSHAPTHPSSGIPLPNPHTQPTEPNPPHFTPSHPTPSHFILTQPPSLSIVLAPLSLKQCTSLLQLLVDEVMQVTRFKVLSVHACLWLVYLFMHWCIGSCLPGHWCIGSCIGVSVHALAVGVSAHALVYRFMPARTSVHCTCIGVSVHACQDMS